MHKKKKKKKHFKGMLDSARGLFAGGLTMGLGSQVLGRIGGTSATHGQQALNNLSGYMPVMGTVMGSSAALGAVKEMGKYKYKKKKKKY